MSAHCEVDDRFMDRALDLARRGWGTTHPNPMVGALIVEDGAVVAEGWHSAAGGPHAEIVALAALKRRPKTGAVLYVTLEPCSTCGRTGACTEAILTAGLARVVVGTLDPNPAHAGRGLKVLRSEGVEVLSGIRESACRDLNLIFNHWIVTGQPMLAVKMAMTLDGKFAAASGHSRWVTGASAREDGMRWRRYFPGIAVGAGTVLADDSRLTSRLGGTVWCPQRFVLDRDLRTAVAVPFPKLYTDTFKEKTLVLCGPSAPPERRSLLEAAGVRFKELAEADGHLDWKAVRAAFAAAGLAGVYIEAGPGLATGLIESGEADYVFVYQAAKFMSDAAALGVGSVRQTESMAAAIELKQVEHAVFGSDFLTRGVLSGF